MAISAVSRSRISPTMITSGSARRTDAQTGGERHPRLDRHLHLLDPLDRRLDRVLDRHQASLPVVDRRQAGVQRGRLARPGRAGDEHRPVGLLDRVGEALAARPRACRATAGRARRRPVSRIRMTIPSPPTSGSETTRTSTLRPSTVTAIRPSWGTRRSAMSSPPMILIRETTDGASERGTVLPRVRTPSTRNITCISVGCGSRWMSDAPAWTASVMICWTSLTAGPSASAIVASSSATADCGPLDRATSSSERLSRAISLRMSSRGGGGGPHPPAR